MGYCPQPYSVKSCEIFLRTFESKDTNIATKYNILINKNIKHFTQRDD